MLNKNNLVKYLLALIICVAFFVFIQKYTGWDEVIHLIIKLNFSTIIILFLLIFSSYITRALRIYYYFNSDYQGSFKTYLKISVYHNFLNNILPMRTGELSYPFLLKKNLDMSIKNSSSSLIWFRFLDLITLITLILLVQITISTLLSQSTFFYFIIGLSFIAPAILFYSAKYISIPLDSNSNLFVKLLNFLVTSIPKTTKGLISSWFFTISTWFLKLSVFAWFISSSLQIDLSNGLLAAIASEFTSILPIHSFAGFGTYEAGIIGTLAHQDLTDTKAIVVSATSLHLIILTSTILSTLVFLFVKEKK